MRRTRSGSARWIGASAAGELAQPLAAAAARRAQLARSARPPTTSATRAAAARHHRAERRRLGALALGVGGVLDVGAGVAAAVVGAHGGADGEVASTARRRGRRASRREVARQLGVAAPASSTSVGVDPSAHDALVADAAAPSRSSATFARSRARSESGAATASSSTNEPSPVDLVEVDAHRLPQQQAAALLDHDVDAERLGQRGGSAAGPATSRAVRGHAHRGVVGRA